MSISEFLIIHPLREVHWLRENESDDGSASSTTPTNRPRDELRNHAHSSHEQGRSARGSTAISASADLLWIFQAPDQDSPAETANLAGTLLVKGRFGPATRLSIKSTEGLHWTVEGDGDVHDTARGKILNCLTPSPDGLNCREITDASKVSLRTVQNLMPTLLAELPRRIEVASEGHTEWRPSVPTGHGQQLRSLAVNRHCSPFHIGRGLTRGNGRHRVLHRVEGG